ncbi:meiosis-specific with OB domain-containing protein [Euwallacea similis]|uniref:meiosis-specific with OB domain-containing protein n=1 Tax=Euwallacea similis TaxID=1736056 RepID=UPI00344E85D6
MDKIKSNYNRVALQRVDLKNLNTNLTNVIVIGIIIGKQRPNIFVSQTSESGPITKAVWNFTIRDSMQHYINVSYWGSAEQILEANDKFRTGSVVEIVNPQIIVRKLEDKSEYFRPMVTSPYKLSLNERSAIVSHSDGTQRFKELLHISTKPTAMFVPLHDILTRGQSIKYADVLGAVRGLNSIRTVNTKNNQTIQVRDVEVFDYSAPSFKISIWEPDIITRSEAWKPRTTILFLADLKIEWSEFHKAYIGQTSGRTIVTENPAMSKETKELYEYAQVAPIETFDIVEQFVASLPAGSIAVDEVVTVNQLHHRINRCLTNKQTGNSSFTVVLFAFVTQLDLDGLIRPYVVKCGYCKVLINQVTCENPDCRAVFDNDLAEQELAFNVNISLSDHTGTLKKCKLGGPTAEEVLKCSPKQFASMSEEEKCNLKWLYLLEQCKVHVAVIFALSQTPIVSVLHVERANPVEVSRKLPVY